MEQKKFKWPKFLSIKRMIFFAILFVAVILLLTYFLGGYTEAKTTIDLMPFDPNGFKEYSEYLNETVEQVKERNANYQQSVALVTKDNIDTLLPQLIDEMKTDVNQKALKNLLSELKQGLSTEELKKYNELISVMSIIQLQNEEEYNQQFDEIINAVNAENYKQKLESAIYKIKTNDNKSKVEAKIKEIQAAYAISDETYNKYWSTINSADCLTVEKYAKSLLDNYELLYKNNEFAFYFNYQNTTFRLDQIKDGNKSNVLNSWYSNPQQKEDENSKNKKNSMYQQQSPIILKFINRSGAMKQYTAYEYCICDEVVEDKNVTTVMPSFSIKENKENNSIQVYYDFRVKDIYYYYFPQFLYETRIEELIKISQQKAGEIVEQLDEYLNENNIKELQKYVEEHMNNITIYNYFFNYSSYVGLQALLYLEDITGNVDENNYVDIIDSYHEDINMLHKIACMMARIEYEADLLLTNPARNLTLSTRETYYLKSVYDKTTEQEATTDSEGNLVNNNYREVTPYSGMKKIARNSLNQVFYTKFFYTADDLEADQKTFDVTVEPTNVTFKVAVEYQLTENGIKCSIINNSIYESNPTYYPLFQIDILPYFTSVVNQVQRDEMKYDTNGYMVIPDGSGAIISLNNGKSDYTQYSKRIYSTDLAYGYKVKQAETKDIMLPMYGITSNRMKDNNDVQFQNAYQIVVRATTGASQAVINSQVSLFNDSYNKTYMSTTYRESQVVTIGTGYYAKEITKYTPDYVKVDTVINYYFKSSETSDFNYSDVAKFYQSILINEGVISKDNYDKTDDVVFNAEVLGIYDYTTNFLGIVYDGYDTLTTLDEAVQITKDLREWGANDINLIYRGWRKGGLINESFNNMSFGSRLGNRTSYNNFLKYIKENNITLYPLTSFIEINKYKEAYGKSRYSTRDVSSEYTVKYPYDLASNVYNKKANPIYTLSPRFFNTFAEKLVKNYKSSNPELNGMAFEKLGSAIVGDYKKHHIFYRYNSLVEQIKTFDTLTAGGIENICLNSPYEYVIPYVDNITNLTYDSTLYEVFDYSIPLYQLIFSGYIDYSGLVINENDEKGLNNHLMNIFKTGSNIHFVFSYDSSSKLIQTDYNYYYYTQYSQWKSEVQELITEINKYQLHKYVLDYFEQYGNNSNVYVSTYKNKQASINNEATSDVFKVYLNYSDKSIDIINRNGEAITIEKWNYYVDKEV